MLQNILAGFAALFTWENILFLVFGTLVGLIIGALPGLTGNMAIALMVPITYTMSGSSLAVTGDTGSYVRATHIAE